MASRRPRPPSTSPTPPGSASSKDATMTAGWLGNTFTLADCAAAPALHYADVVHPLDRDAHPALAAYSERVLRRPSVARVVDEDRPYRELFPLPWPAHVS
jgi:glutathione S-transferase